MQIHSRGVYNIGNNNPISLMDYIHAIEKALAKKVSYHWMDMQAGDVPSTYADVSGLEKDFGYTPKTTVEEGVQKFVDWYRAYYQS